MPVRSAKWLAGVAAAVGLTLVGTGCQSVQMRCSQCGAGPTGSGGTATSLGGRSAAYSPSVADARPAPVTPAYSQVVYPPAHATVPASPVVTLQRPQRRPLFGSTASPAASGAMQGGPILPPIVSSHQPQRLQASTSDSSWTPVQRVHATDNDLNGGTQLVSMDRPQIVPGGIGSVPTRYAAPPGKKENDLLPKPKQQPGYSFLPPVAVTHPVHAPREFEKRTLSAYIIEHPDVLQIEGTPDLINPDKSVQLSGPAIVGPDGCISLATLGRVFVAGKTIDEAKVEIAQVIQRRQPDVKLEEILGKLKIDIAAFNSKFFYVISDGAGYGEQVVKVPITGNDTILDAVAAIQGLPAVASKKRIWLARATPAHSEPQILPVDWQGIAMGGRASTNYQMFPGDRLYIQSDRLLNFNSALGKVLAPVERILGVTLLGASTVQTIRQGNQFGGNQGLGGVR